MEIRCDRCGHVSKLRGEGFGDRERIELACPTCGRIIQIVNPTLATFRQEPTKKKVEPLSSDVGSGGRALRLPADQEISLRALEGKEKGTVYPVTKPRVTIGRGNADIIVSDLMISRLHCALEIGDDGVMLVDLGSTNGTFVDGRQVEATALSNGAMFTVGEHLFQLVISSKET